MTNILDFPVPPPVSDKEKIVEWMNQVATTFQALGVAMKAISDYQDGIERRLARIEKKLSAGEDE